MPPEGVKQLRSRVRTQGNEIPPYVIPLSAQAIAIVQRLMRLRGRGAVSAGSPIQTAGNDQ